MQCSHVLYTSALWTTHTFLSTPPISTSDLPSSDEHSSLARSLFPCGLNLPTHLFKTRSTSLEVFKSGKYLLRHQRLKFAIAEGAGGAALGRREKTFVARIHNDTGAVISSLNKESACTLSATRPRASRLSCSACSLR